MLEIVKVERKNDLEKFISVIYRSYMWKYIVFLFFLFGIAGALKKNCTARIVSLLRAA